MPTVTARTAQAYAHCPDSLCEGNEQVPVAAVRELVEQTIGENGGDGVFVGIVERSWVNLRFVDPDEVPCSTCGRDRELSEQPRPGYQRLFGPPDALHRVRKAGLSGPLTAEGVLAAAAEAASREPTAREALDMRYVQGQIEDAEYFAKRAALGGEAA